ncbi:hypothetical protein G7Z17_g1585 [Cylindrodendrum hubeiense]|uniref:UBC core domain-containing protein n=1 Tax=Cylindrodendrum hubeiense TaxID=595255 RepID=A0A9P5HJB1_9HYPO|nr:hypothetical protein G7Z17_g1585 [Cylindrodendrum hubeiense]
MEVTGLAIGIVGLAGLFKTTLEAWEFVDAARDHAENFNYLKTRLDNQRAIFLIWAERLEFFSSSGYNKALNSPQRRAHQIADTLKQIAVLFSNVDQLAQKYGFKIVRQTLVSLSWLDSNSPQGGSSAIFGDRYANLRTIVRGERSPKSRLDIFHTETQRQQDSASIWTKTKWSIRDEKKTTVLIDQITALVDDLDKLTRDIPVAKTMEQLAAEAVSEVSRAALIEIEESSRGRETIISSAASIRLSMFGAQTVGTASTRTGTFVTAGTRPSSHQEPQSHNAVTIDAINDEDQTHVQFLDFSVVETENRQACAALLSHLGVVTPGQSRSGTNAKRIHLEMVDWVERIDPNGWYTISPISDSRIDAFLGTLRGPTGTPYESGIFHVRINAGKPYPFRAPKVWFLTRILHPNIDVHGAICMSILDNGDEHGWSPAITMEKLLVCLASLLDEPNWDNPVESALPLEWTPNKDEFKLRAREWTRKYATGRIIYPGEREDGFYTVSELATTTQTPNMVAGN